MTRHCIIYVRHIQYRPTRVVKAGVFLPIKRPWPDESGVNGGLFERSSRLLNIQRAFAAINFAVVVRIRMLTLRVVVKHARVIADLRTCSLGESSDARYTRRSREQVSFALNLDDIPRWGEARVMHRQSHFCNGSRKMVLGPAKFGKPPGPRSDLLRAPSPDGQWPPST